MDILAQFTKALLDANPDDCRRMLSLRPQLAQEPIERCGSMAHPLILLAQWPGRLPQGFDGSAFRSRVIDCAHALFESGADLSAPAASGAHGSCAGALLARMRQHREMDERWGVEPAPSPESAIMQASLACACPELAQRSAKAWLDAAQKLRCAKLESGFPQFLALARSIADRAAIESACHEGPHDPREPRRL